MRVHGFKHRIHATQCLLLVFLVLGFQACSRPKANDHTEELSYESLDEVGPHFKLIFFSNGHYGYYQGLRNCGVPGTQLLQISEERIQELIRGFHDADFFSIPRIPKTSYDPWGVTLAYRDSLRIHEVVDYRRDNPKLVRLEEMMRKAVDVEKYLKPSVQVYRDLVASGWDVNTPGEDRGTAIAHAAQQQDLESVTFLLQQDADVSLDTLEFAAAGKNPEIFFSLLKAAKSNLNAPEKFRILISAAQGDISVARRMIESGLDLNATDREGTTPLIAAVHFHNTDLAKVLIASGADVHLRTLQGSRTPLMEAVACGSLPCTQLLLEKGAAVNLRDEAGRTALWYAAAATNDGFITALARHGADLDATDKEGQTALMHAMSMCYEWNIRALLDAGANPSITDKSGRSAIQQSTIAANDPKCDRCRKLIEDVLAGPRKMRR